MAPTSRQLLAPATNNNVNRNGNWNELRLEQRNGRWLGFVNNTQVFNVPAQNLKGTNVGFVDVKFTHGEADSLSRLAELIFNNTIKEAYRAKGTPFYVNKPVIFFYLLPLFFEILPLENEYTALRLRWPGICTFLEAGTKRTMQQLVYCPW